jgi:hypothetical protein
MPTSGGFVEPLIKAVIYGTVAGVFAMIWAMAGLASMSSFFGMHFSSGIYITILIYSIISAIIGLFIGGVILLILSAICSGNTDYEANVRVTAALMVLWPVHTLLSFTSGINPWLGGIISLAVFAYSLYLLYISMVTTLKANENTIKIITIVLAAILGFFIILSLTCAKVITTVGDKYKSDTEKYLKQDEKTLKEMNKIMEELRKQQDKM